VYALNFTVFKSASETLS